MQNSINVSIKSPCSENFNKFITAKGAPDWVTDSHISEYNSYDNAVLYNDYVVSSIIMQLKKRQEASLMVYFSDHGEEVFDTLGNLFCGRNEGKPTPAMYTVPFIVWSNSLYNSQHKTSHWLGKLSNPMTTADFLYTWADMVGLSFSGMDYSRSAISDQFVRHSRWIGNPATPKLLRDYSDIAPPPYIAESATSKKPLTDTTL